MSQSVDDGYETVELTDNQIERFLEGEIVDLGEYTWSDWQKSNGGIDLRTTRPTVVNLRYGSKEMIRWPERDFAVTYDADDDDEYETVELTDEQIERIIDGESITVDGWTFGNRSHDDADCSIDTLGLEYLERGEPMEWSNKGLRVVYAGDQHDSDQNPREIAEDIVDDTQQETKSAMDFSGVDQPHTNTDMKTIDDADRETVTMEVTMNISDMDDTDKEVICELARQYEDSFQSVVEKNRDYSWSFLTTGTKLAQSEGTPFESATRCQAFSLLTRIGDKHERLIENVYGDGAAAVSDEADVTAQEAANYYQLLAFVLGNPNLSQKASDS